MRAKAKALKSGHRTDQLTVRGIYLQDPDGNTTYYAKTVIIDTMRCQWHDVGYY